MEFVKNFPFFSIILAMSAGIISSVLDGKNAKRLTYFVTIAVGIMSGVLLVYLLQTGESYTYMMGHYEAPWGNEIRAGVLEAMMGLFVCVVMILSLLGGNIYIFEEIEDTKINLYFILIDLLLSSLLALIYTNDLFTAYVFIEINTISACGLIAIKQIGRTTLAATRYMIMSLLGSGLILIGLTLLYDLTGHLLMSDIKETIENIVAQGTYQVPLAVIVGLISVGLAIKSALYPFHTWLPGAYSYSTVASSAILSSLVSKGYIFLLIKIFYRVIGIDIIAACGIDNVFFVFGLIGIIMGSLHAIKERDIRRMVAYSSVAQIGYIYVGIGLGNELGIIAAIFHMFSHGATKALLFISAMGLSEASGNSKSFSQLSGAGYRNIMAGISFTIGALSMVGLPLFSGFISKLCFSAASLQVSGKMLPTLIVLAISTVLNAVYFLRAVIIIYTPVQADKYKTEKFNRHSTFVWAMIFFMAANILLGTCSQPIVEAIKMGIHMFA